MSMGSYFINPTKNVKPWAYFSPHFIFNVLNSSKKSSFLQEYIFLPTVCQANIICIEMSTCRSSCHNLVSPNYLSQSASKLPRRCLENKLIVILWSCLSKNSHHDNNICTFFLHCVYTALKIEWKAINLRIKIFVPLCIYFSVTLITYYMCQKYPLKVFDSPSFWIQRRIFCNIYVIKFLLCGTENFSTKSNWT